MPLIDPESLLIVAGVGALAGAVGSLVGGRSPSLVASVILGGLAGSAAALVMRAFEADAIIGVGGLSVVYAALAGFVMIFAVAYSAGRD